MFTNSGHKLSREKIQFATPRHMSRVRNGLTRKVSHPMHVSSLSSVYNILVDVYDFDFGIGVYVFLDPNRSPFSLNPSLSGFYSALQTFTEICWREPSKGRGFTIYLVLCTRSNETSRC